MNEDQIICSDCGKVITDGEGYFHEPEIDRCKDCHNESYPDINEWIKLCEKNEDEFYYSELNL